MAHALLAYSAMATPDCYSSAPRAGDMQNLSDRPMTLLRGRVQSLRRMGKRLAFAIVHTEEESSTSSALDGGLVGQVEAVSAGLATPQPPSHRSVSNSGDSDVPPEVIVTSELESASTATLQPLPCGLSRADSKDGDSPPAVMSGRTVQLTVRDPAWIKVVRQGCFVVARVSPEKRRVGAASEPTLAVVDAARRAHPDADAAVDMNQGDAGARGRVAPAHDAPASSVPRAPPLAQYECVHILEVLSTRESEATARSSGRGAYENCSTISQAGKRRRVEHVGGQAQQQQQSQLEFQRQQELLILPGQPQLQPDFHQMLRLETH